MSKHFTAEFKLEAGKLVLDHGIRTYKPLRRSMLAIRPLPAGVNKLRIERQGQPSAGLPLTPEKIELRTMQKKIQRL